MIIIKKNVSSFGESYIIKENNNTLKSYKVNREIINSDEYKNKFDGIGSKKQIQVICKETKRIVKRNDGISNEHMSIVDNKGNIVTNQNVGSFGGNVDLSHLKDMPDNSVVLTHNNALSTSFSGDDIALLMDNPQIKTIIAAGHDGTVYKLSIGKGTRIEYDEVIRRNKVEQEYRHLARIGKEINEIVERLGENYNWIYEVI